MIEIKKLKREKEVLKQTLWVIRESFATVAQEFHLTEVNCPSNGAFMKIEQLYNEIDKGKVYFGLFDGNVLAGVISVHDEGSNSFEIGRLAVLPEFRHKGYGSILLGFAKEHVKSLGGVTLILGLIDQNIVLKKWYVDHGFAVENTKQYKHLPFEVCFMKYVIK